MSLFLTIVYLGGAFYDFDRPIGLWKRLVWPDYLGRALVKWISDQGVFDESRTDETKGHDE